MRRRGGAGVAALMGPKHDGHRAAVPSVRGRFVSASDGRARELAVDEGCFAPNPARALHQCTDTRLHSDTRLHTIHERVDFHADEPGCTAKMTSSHMAMDGTAQFHEAVTVLGRTFGRYAA